MKTITIKLVNERSLFKDYLDFNESSIYALSLYPPYATLVAILAKKIETRSWEIKYRGLLAIHATKSFPKWANEICSKEPFKSTLASAGYNSYKELPTGKVVALSNIVDCFQFTADNIPDEPEYSFGDYSPGRYGIVLANTIRLPEPILAKGSQRLWKWRIQ